MTFSLTGRCTRTGRFGIAVSTSSIAVTSRCVWLRGGVGAVASQNMTNPALGKLGLDLLEGGEAPEAVLSRLIAEDGEHIAYRQLTMVGREGEPVAYSGANCFPTFAEAKGRDSVAAGNLLASADVPQAMIATFEAHPGLELPERLLRGLEEGLVAGGETGPVRSAGLCVVDRYVWPICDLRVDWADHPIGRLREILTEFAPQMQTFVARAFDPANTPVDGVSDR